MYFFAYVAGPRKQVIKSSTRESIPKKTHHIAINESLLANDIFCFAARPQAHHVWKISKPTIAIKAVPRHE
jgi:hypothetical protein